MSKTIDFVSGSASPHQTRQGEQSSQGIVSDPLEFLMSLSKRGDVVRYTTGYFPACLINHPDYIRHVFQTGNYVRGALLKLVLGEGLLASEGPYWRSQRRLMQPSFQHERITQLGAMMTQITRGRLERWENHARARRPIDMEDEMTDLTLRIIGKTLFGIDWNDELDGLREAITLLVDDGGYFSRTLVGVPYQVDPSRNRRFANALRALDQIVYDVIDKRSRSEERFDDLLSVLLSHADRGTGVRLNDRQVRDEFVTMLVAGHVTTANMLAWTWYLLSQHSLIERRLHEELESVLGGRLPSVQDLPKLQYARMILQETLRLYPPVWLVGRRALQADNIGPYHFSANATVVVSSYVTHRHPDYWEVPDQFIPERFLPERSAGRHPLAYFPFGGGHHTCIGNHLAMMEGQLVLATIAQRYRFRVVPGKAIAPEPLLTLKIRDGLPMILEERTRGN
jgi:cytochrome P450